MQFLVFLRDGLLQVSPFVVFYIIRTWPQIFLSDLLYPQTCCLYCSCICSFPIPSSSLDSEDKFLPVNWPQETLIRGAANWGKHANWTLKLCTPIRNDTLQDVTVNDKINNNYPPHSSKIHKFSKRLFTGSYILINHAVKKKYWFQIYSQG